MSSLSNNKWLHIVKTKKFQPCCGLFLQGGVKAISIVEFTVHFFMIVIISVGIIVGQPVWKEDSPERHLARPFYWTFYYTFFTSSMVLSVILFRAAIHRNEHMCRKYLIFSAILYIMWTGIYLSHSIWLHGLHPMVIALFGVFTVYRLYALWVVKCFYHEIQYYGGFNAALRQLSDAEVEEFEHGQVGRNSVSLISNFDALPYQQNFEIPLSDIHFEESYILGQGAFGVVHKGYLKKAGDVYIPVAVKTISQYAEISQFKALLSELKILSYIGQHEHVVSLVGACTAEIRRKQVHIVVEFCALGNMANYLKANRGVFVNQIQKNQISPDYKEGPYSKYLPASVIVSTEDLIKWSYQTALGMEYIASKKVVHGDLASRNILLTHNKDVKISDFGLSRQLYNYTTYIKKNQEPLPWRWLAPESMHDLHFSSRSDVWMLGVTLWEYFSLSSIPYGGCTWSLDFVQKLKNGLRLHRPQFATQEIYEMMTSCWKLDPEQRPDFSTIASFFFKILNIFKENRIQSTNVTERVHL